LKSNPEFTGYEIAEIEEGSLPEMKGNVFAQTSVESKFQFDGNGDLVKTSFLSLDLLTMAMVLGISEGKTWNSIYADTKGTSDEFNDGNIYEFMRSMAE
jgi:hypothetical protein